MARISFSVISRASALAGLVIAPCRLRDRSTTGSSKARRFRGLTPSDIAVFLRLDPSNAITVTSWCARTRDTRRRRRAGYSLTARSSAVDMSNKSVLCGATASRGKRLLRLVGREQRRLVDSDARSDPERQLVVRTLRYGDVARCVGARGDLLHVGRPAASSRP
jgi:hypothetical protein